MINLGAGNDTITLGANETVNGGAGTDIYNVTKSTIGNTTIKGGAGSNTLVVTGGGNATMGTKITGINAVQLAATTTFTANTTAGLKISGSSTGGDTITLGAATQSVIAGGANETIKATAANAGASISGLGANSTLQITNGGTVALNAATDVSTVKLSAASNLTLNGMQFIRGWEQRQRQDHGRRHRPDADRRRWNRHADWILRRWRHLQRHRRRSERRHHRWLRGQRHDRLTNLASAGATVTTAASGTNTTKVTVVSGATKSVFTVSGMSSSGFLLTSDGAAGTFLTHT